MLIVADFFWLSFSDFFLTGYGFKWREDVFKLHFFKWFEIVRYLG